MNISKKARLQSAGWVVADSTEFLNLNPEEAQFVEWKLALAEKEAADRSVIKRSETEP
jgi:hypothetical protein